MIQTTLINEKADAGQSSAKLRLHAIKKSDGRFAVYRGAEWLSTVGSCCAGNRREAVSYYMSYIKKSTSLV